MKSNELSAAMLNKKIRVVMLDSEVTGRLTALEWNSELEQVGGLGIRSLHTTARLHGYRATVGGHVLRLGGGEYVEVLEEARDGR